MRVLLMATPVPSHLTPLTPLVWALRAAGHQVLLAGQPDLADAARAAGVSIVPVGAPFHVEDLLFEGLPDGRRPIEVRPRPAPAVLGNYGRVWMTHAKYLLPRYLEVAREYRPDLILSDPLEYSALVVGGVLGVPVVQHRWGVDAISTPARHAVRPAFAGICRRLGLAGLPDPTVLLDPCPPALQLTEAEPGTPIRYVPFNGAGELPSWVRAAGTGPGSAGVRRVAVTLGGTLAVNGVPFLRRLLAALGGRPGIELVATVDARHRDALGAVPDGVHVVDPTPLDLFLPGCAAVVHHGGSGTTMTATAFGRPQLVLPQLADHFGHGDRLAALGAGLALDTAEAQHDPALLRDALDALLTEPGYAKAAAELRADIERAPSPARVAADLARLVPATAQG
jgi:UDP:flavonoid glycosyltransferase YjiC (YdhE family)